MHMVVFAVHLDRVGFKVEAEPRENYSESLAGLPCEKSFMTRLSKRQQRQAFKFEAMLGGAQAISSAGSVGVWDLLTRLNSRPHVRLSIFRRCPCEGFDNSGPMWVAPCGMTFHSLQLAGLTGHRRRTYSDCVCFRPNASPRKAVGLERGLQQPLFLFFLAGDAIAGPG